MAEKLPATDLRTAYPRLCAPFSARLVELKPGATTRDKTRALGMPYVDVRAYQHRLDQVAGPEGWQLRYQVGDRGVACELTILGVTKSALGDYPAAGDDNPVTSAEAQAFKRACSAFGLGRYLYRLPLVWGDYDAEKKRLTDPEAMIVQMYAALPRDGEE